MWPGVILPGESCTIMLPPSLLLAQLNDHYSQSHQARASGILSCHFSSISRNPCGLFLCRRLVRLRNTRAASLSCGSRTAAASLDQGRLKRKRGFYWAETCSARHTERHTNGFDPEIMSRKQLQFRSAWHMWHVCDLVLTFALWEIGDVPRNVINQSKIKQNSVWRENTSKRLYGYS